MHLFKPNTGFTVEANNKSIQQKQRTEIAKLRLMLGDFILDKENETQMILKKELKFVAYIMLEYFYIKYNSLNIN